MLEKMKQYQFLFEELVKRDFKKKYKGTVLGVAWSALAPLLQLLIMRLVFTHFFGGSIPHYSTFLFCGNIIFGFFSETTTTGMTSLVDNAPIFSKVNLPKYLFVLAKIAQTALNFLITLFVFFVLCLFDGVSFSWRMLMLIYPVCMLMIFNFGCCLILSALYLFFRDMLYLWSVFTTLLCYASAIFYDISTFPQKYQNIFLLNPVYLFIRYFRKIVLDLSVPSWQFHVLMAFDAFFVLALGAHLYKKYNTEFLYYI